MLQDRLKKAAKPRSREAAKPRSQDEIFEMKEKAVSLFGELQQGSGGPGRPNADCSRLAELLSYVSYAQEKTNKKKMDLLRQVWVERESPQAKYSDSC